MIARLKKYPVILAIVLSLLLHTALLLGPNLVKLTPIEVQLPPLVAHLEMLPAIKKSVPLRAKLHPKPPAKAFQASKPVVAESKISPAPVSTVESMPVEAVAPVETAAPVEAAEQLITAPAHPLPRHAELTFIAYKGTNLRIGEVRHRLDIDGNNHYTLHVGMNTSGIASLFKTFVMNQQSSGKVDAQGLQPDTFSEQKLTSKGTQNLSAQFDWQNKQLNFFAGDHVALPDTAQDILSFLYQFSQMPLNQPMLQMSVFNGKKLETYQIEAGDEEEIRTPLGILHALPLRKIHAPGEEGLEIWLGLEYRLLPVKVVQIDRHGEVAGELDISEIRVSRE